MSATLLWLQTGACSGDSMSILNAESPNLLEALQNYDIELLWHPSLSPETPRQLAAMIEDICAGERELSVLAVEGSIAFGPDGTGMYDTFLGRPKKDIVSELAEHARFVVAMGTCAAFGGVVAAEPNPTDSTGLQFLRANKQGALLGPDWVSRGGLPVVNVAGCPAHPRTMVETLMTLLLTDDLELDALNRPLTYFDRVVHQGCTRNEFHEYNIEESGFGGQGCLYYNMGCQGPFTQGRCNTDLWNEVNSKPRAGVPCYGCTAPTFPKLKDLLTTEKIGPIPVAMPSGVSRPQYMAYKGLARAAGPERLVKLRRKAPAASDGRSRTDGSGTAE